MKIRILLLTLIIEGFIIDALISITLNMSSNTSVNTILLIGIGIISIVGVAFLAYKVLADGGK